MATGMKADNMYIDVELFDDTNKLRKSTNAFKSVGILNDDDQTTRVDVCEYARKVCVRTKRQCAHDSDDDL